MEEFDINDDSEIGTSISKLNNNINESFKNSNNDTCNLRQGRSNTQSITDSNTHNTHLNTNTNPNTNININTDTDIDYDRILENLNNSETGNNKTNFNYDKVRKNMQTFTSTISDGRPKKALNMTQFAKNVESDLERFQNVRTYNYNVPLPGNYSKNLLSVNNNSIQKLEPMTNIKPPVNTNIEKTEENKKEPALSSGFSTAKIAPEKKRNSLLNIFNEYRDILIFVLFFILLNNKFIIGIIYDRFPYINKFESPYPNLIVRSLIFGILIFTIKKFNL
jgi:hypothetical protein